MSSGCGDTHVLLSPFPIGFSLGVSDVFCKFCPLGGCRDRMGDNSFPGLCPCRAAPFGSALAREKGQNLDTGKGDPTMQVVSSSPWV